MVLSIRAHNPPRKTGIADLKPVEAAITQGAGFLFLIVLLHHLMSDS